MDFKELSAKYKKNKPVSIDWLYKDYITRKSNTIVDALSSAVGISAIVNTSNIDFEAITPQMEEAFQLSFPNKSLESLTDLTPESLQGVISNWKGKLFEVKVRDQLNNGDLVGNIQLGEGQYAAIAEKVNQPGWDLQIFNADGTVNDFFQLKATESMSYINDALEKYPDIDILSTSEVAGLSQNLLDSKISNEALTAPLTDIFDANENVIDFLLPSLPFLIIVASEGRKVFVKKSDWDTAVNNIGSRAIKTGLAMGVGWLAFDFTGIGWVGLGASALFRWGIDYFERDEKIMEIIPLVIKKKEEILLLKTSYN